jgi:hypothetical protein
VLFFSVAERGWEISKSTGQASGLIVDYVTGIQSKKAAFLEAYNLFVTTNPAKKCQRFFSNPWFFILPIYSHGCAINLE